MPIAEHLREDRQSSNPAWTMKDHGIKNRTFATAQEALDAAAAIGAKVNH